MVSYLILCRSLTHAQRTARVLERAGIRGYVMRTPHDISEEGCGYCVKIAEKFLSAALVRLRAEGIGPKRVFILHSPGEYNEVTI